MIRKTIFFLIVPFITSSCIEMEERIEVRSDRSGSITYAVKSSEAGFVLFGLSGLLGLWPDEEILIHLDHIIRILEEQPGIENIRYDFNNPYGRLFLSFDFASDGDLNRALYSIARSEKKMFSPGYLKICRTSVRKRNFSPYIGIILKNDDSYLNRILQSNILTYNSVITLPREIKNTNRKEITLSPGQKTVSKKYRVKDIVENNVNTRIRLKY